MHSVSCFSLFVNHSFLIEFSWKTDEEVDVLYLSHRDISHLSLTSALEVYYETNSCHRSRQTRRLARKTMPREEKMIL